MMFQKNRKIVFKKVAGTLGIWSMWMWLSAHMQNLMKASFNTMEYYFDSDMSLSSDPGYLEFLMLRLIDNCH